MSFPQRGTDEYDDAVLDITRCLTGSACAFAVGASDDTVILAATWYDDDTDIITSRVAYWHVRN